MNRKYNYKRIYSIFIFVIGLFITSCANVRQNTPTRHHAQTHSMSTWKIRFEKVKSRFMDGLHVFYKRPDTKIEERPKVRRDSFSRLFSISVPTFNKSSKEETSESTPRGWDVLSLKKNRPTFEKPKETLWTKFLALFSKRSEEPTAQQKLLRNLQDLKASIPDLNLNEAIKGKHFIWDPDETLFSECTILKLYSLFDSDFPTELTSDLDPTVFTFVSSLQDISNIYKTDHNLEKCFDLFLLIVINTLEKKDDPHDLEIYTRLYLDIKKLITHDYTIRLLVDTDEISLKRKPISSYTFPV